MVKSQLSAAEEGEVVPLHCTTVPLRTALAVNLKVDVMSAAPSMSRGPTLVRVARKSKPAHCMVLQVTLSLRGVVGTNRTRDSTTKIGATVQEIAIAAVTLQVKVTSLLGQAACLPSRVEVRVMVAGSYTIRCI